MPQFYGGINRLEEFPPRFSRHAALCLQLFAALRESKSGPRAPEERLLSAAQRNDDFLVAPGKNHTSIFDRFKVQLVGLIAQL